MKSCYKTAVIAVEPGILSNITSAEKGGEAGAERRE